MATGPQRTRPRDRSRRRARGRGRRIVAWIVWLAFVAAVFVAGLAVGRAVEDAPQPGGTRTSVRTIQPLTVEPQERTVTVTTSAS